MLNKYRVLLPNWVFNGSENKEDQYALALEYMQRYPHYYVVQLADQFAICERVKEEDLA